MKRVLVSLALVISLAACGKRSSPSGPSEVSPASVQLTLLAMRDSHRVGTQTCIAGQLTKIAVNGFLASTFICSTGEATVFLWEDDSVLPGDYTKSIVYISGTHQLIRPHQGAAFTINADAALMNSPNFQNALEQGTRKTSEATLGNVSFVTGGAGTGQGFVTFVSDPNDSICGSVPGAAATYRLMDGYYIVGAKIVVCDVKLFWGDNLQRMISHEEGHVLGLDHGPKGTRGMMSGSDPLLDFSPIEKEEITKMFLRPASNKWPDDRTSVSANSQTSKSLRWELVQE